MSIGLQGYNNSFTKIIKQLYQLKICTLIFTSDLHFEKMFKGTLRKVDVKLS